MSLESEAIGAYYYSRDMHPTGKVSTDVELMQGRPHQTILVVSIIDSNFDADTCIDQTNNGRWNTNEVRVATVASSCEARQNRNVSKLSCRGNYSRSV